MLLKLTIFSVIFISARALDNSKNITILHGTGSNTTTKHVVPNAPLVIHTEIQQYDQPTLREFQECHEKLDKCRKLCETSENPISCVDQCPICPILIKEKVIVEGINDTDIKTAHFVAQNSTNIIRLTNQIQNIIDSHRGNISLHNDNLVRVYQNASRVGGKFGLGYNNTDPCCISVKKSRKCLRQQFSTAHRCRHKRHRVCGKQCIARTIMAKRTTLCQEDLCHNTLQYVPYHVPRKSNLSFPPKCSSIPSWPYIRCGPGTRRIQNKSICQRCNRVSYYWILKYGIPAQCNQCFSLPHRTPFTNSPYTPWYPNMGFYPQYNNYDIEYSDDDGDDDYQVIDLNLDNSSSGTVNGKGNNKNGFDNSGAGAITSAPPTFSTFDNSPSDADEYEDYNDGDDDEDNEDIDDTEYEVYRHRRRL